MSELPPSSGRSIAPTPRAGRRWLSRHRGLGLWGISLFALGVVLYVLTPSGKEEQQKPYRDQPRATHAEYVPPKPTVQEVVYKPPPPQPTPQPQPQADLRSSLNKSSASDTALEPPKLTVYSFGHSTQMPEYMKAKIVAATQTDGASVKENGGVAYEPTVIKGTKSFTIRDRSRILPEFSTIPCILDTEVVTGATGITPFRCHLPDDVQSPLHVTLMEAETRVGGYYQSVVGEGQNRVVTVTATAETPNGVVIQLGGPVADPMGAAGVPGSVDNHWKERLGGALLLTAADAILGLTEAEIQKNSQQTNINLGNGGGGGGLSTLAQQLLSKTISIPPTISLHRGDRVMLWTTEYKNFDPSYRLEVAR